MFGEEPLSKKKPTKKSPKNQAKKQGNKAYQKQNSAQNKSGQSSWRTIVTWIIVIMVVLGLVGSMSIGLIASVYSAPLPSTQTTPLVSTTQEGRYLQPQPGDLVDGKPAEDYASVTDDLPYVSAPMAGVCTSDGRILYERNIDQKVTMASTTKMMTAIIALETLPLETMLKVTYGAANAIGTHSGLEANMEISLLDCLYALLLPSGNDAALVIAENVSDMESRFVELMNAKAAELGMTSTHYVDASGLSVAPGLDDGTGPTDEDHYSTVRDYLVLARYCMSNPTFRQIVGTNYHEANINGTIIGFETTDALGDYLVTVEPLGIKTGYTDEAGYCFVGAGDKGGIELYTVVFNAETAEQRFADTAELLEWGLRHYRTIEIINTSQQVAEVALTSWIDKTVAAYVPSVIRTEIFDLAGPLVQDVTINDIEGEATKGQSCGEIIWSQGGEVLTTSNVVVAETVLAPDFWEGVGIWWERFWGGIFGGIEQAETSILVKSELTIPAAAASTE